MAALLSFIIIGCMGFFAYANSTDAPFSYISEGYEDTRISSKENKIVFWRIRQSNLWIEVRTFSKGQVFHIRRLEKSGQTKELVLLKRNDKKLYLISSKVRPQWLYSYTKESTACDPSRSQWDVVLDAYQNIKVSTLNQCVNNSISSSCKENVDPGFQELLLQTSQDLFTPPLGAFKSQKTFMKCLSEDPAITNMFTERFGSEAGFIEHKKALVGYKNKMAQLLSASEESNPQIISCVKTTEKQ
ncbi:MAG: hypothetical protein AAGB31_15605, partial [Bdellovibrio sp.]